MASFSGKQFRGAKRIRKDMKRNEAEVRNKNFQQKKAAKALLAESEAAIKRGDVMTTGEVAKALGIDGVEEGFVS